MVVITVIIFWDSNPWQQRKEACCYLGCWLHTNLKYNRKSLFNRLTIIPQQDKKDTKTKTKKARRVVYIRFRLVDIPDHTAGVEEGAWDGFFIQPLNQLIFILKFYFSLILISSYRCFALRGIQFCIRGLLKPKCILRKIVNAKNLALLSTVSKARWDSNFD